MPQIATYVFFDLETTGLPHQERNRTKVIELSFVATSTRDIQKTSFGDIPPVSKLTFVFNPQRSIHPKVSELTGLSNDLLRHAPTFQQKINSLVTFLEEQQKPVCLVAHNGNIFDYKLLLAEFEDAGMSLPYDLLCVDSLIGFRNILKGTSIDYNTLKTSTVQSINDIMTDDEDEWSDLNVSLEEWQEIDEICLSLSDISCEDLSDTSVSSDKKKPKSKPSNDNLRKKKTEAIKRVMDKKPTVAKECYKLSVLYKRLLNREETNAHRAEADCFMLLYCVVALKNDFLPWAENSCKTLTEIKPLQRY
ncbi:three-prime repair exonuclease 1-like [Choristoneura fumiferana]|uniref:three-prime repair exonuclease 1-like n=1 Tax=Choristoneura fumiferana TaxID=7141 RepID=UPI003D15B768